MADLRSALSELTWDEERLRVDFLKILDAIRAEFPRAPTHTLEGYLGTLLAEIRSLRAALAERDAALELFRDILKHEDDVDMWGDDRVIVMKLGRTDHVIACSTLTLGDIRTCATTLARVEAALAEKKENTPMTDEQIKHMVDRFLQWKLPEDFRPDGGIEFDPISSKGTAYERRREPVGTNLLSATQAEAMVRHMLDGLPALAETSEERVERVARAICKATYYDVEPDMYESEEAFFTKDGPDAWKHFGDSDFMHQARAAIAAMGE